MNINFNCPLKNDNCNMNDCAFVVIVRKKTIDGNGYDTISERKECGVLLAITKYTETTQREN